MPRLTRSALTESPEPTRRSSRAATQASSTSSQATPSPSRGRGSKRGATGDAGDAEEKVIDEPSVEAEPAKTGRGRSQSRKRAEPKEEVTPVVTSRGKRGKAAAATGKKGKSKSPASKKSKDEAVDEEEVEAAKEDEPEADIPAGTADPVVEDKTDATEKSVSKSRSRSRGRPKAEETPQPVTTPSPSSRSRRGRGAKVETTTATPSPVTPSRGRRGRKSAIEPEAATEPATEVEMDTTAEAAPLETEKLKSPQKTAPVSESPSDPPPTADSKTDNVSIKPTPVDSVPAPIETDTSHTETEQIPVETEPTPVETEPTPVETEPTLVETEPIPVKTKPAHVETEPIPVETEPPHAEAEPMSIETYVKPPAPKPVDCESIPVSVEPEPSQASVACHLLAPVLEPITPESEPEPSVPAPAMEDISSMETEPSVSIPIVSVVPDQTPSGSIKRKSRDDDDDVVESSAKKYCFGSDEQTNEAVPAQTVDVEMAQESTSKTEVQVQPTQSETATVSPPPTAQTSEAEAKTEMDDFEIISHEDVPSADSQEVQQSLPVHMQDEQEVSQVESSIPTQSASTIATVPEVSTSEAVCNRAEAAPSLSVNQSCFEGAVSSQMEEAPFQRSHNPMVEDVSPVESSMDSNIGSYGDDRDAIAPQASAADSNVSSQGTVSQVHRSQEPVADSNANEAIPNETNSYNYQPISQTSVNQSEPVTSSQTSNGVGHIETPSSQIKTIEPKITPNSSFLNKYSSDIFHRHFLSNPALTTTVDSQRQFSIVSYNILADCHMRRGDYSYSEEEFLDQDYRHQLLIQELQYLDADIICLQEVNPEYFNSVLKPELERLGYVGDIYKRCKDYFDEGGATFYRTSRFTMVEQKGFNLKDLADKEVVAGGLNDDVQTAVRKYLDKADVVFLSKLRCKNTGKVITIGNIHVVWDSLKTPDVQCIQVTSAVKELVSQAGNDNSPFLLCGDFNSEITFPGYQLTRDGYLSDSNIQKLQSLENLETTEGSKSLVNHLWRAFQHTASNLKSAYNTVQGQEPVVTCYTANMQAAVDYIFYNANSLDVAGTLQVVHDDVIDKTGGLPSAHFPSDHVSVKALFNLKE